MKFKQGVMLKKCIRDVTMGACKGSHQHSGVRRTRGVPTRSEADQVRETREHFRGCADQEAYRPKGKRRRTSSTTSRTEKNFFVYTEETIYVMNTVDELYFKFVITVTTTGRPSPILTGRAAPLSFARQEGLNRGALGDALTGGPYGGGVLRWESERALIVLR